MVKKGDFFYLNLTSSEKITRTNDMFNNIEAHNGIDPKDSNMFNLLSLSVDGI